MEALPRRIYPAKEITANPIFLLQPRRIFVHTLPDGYQYDDDWDIVADDPDDPEDPEILSPVDLLEQYGDEYCHVTWDTERVFFTREEAQSWGDARAYRWSQGFRVYCIPCEGDLSTILLTLTDRED